MNDSTISKQVQTMIACGISVEKVALALDLDLEFLKANYHDELTLSEDKANAEVARALYKQATNGNTQAMIFWLKARAEWKDQAELSITSDITGFRVVSDDVE
jgi:hypothetical protein